MPRKVFTAGEILTAADVNTNLMDQAVMSFASSAARGSAIPSPVEGMVSYLADTDSWEGYTTAWGPLASGFTASTAITATDASWAVPTLASTIVKVTVIGGGGGGGSSAANVSQNGSNGSNGGTTTFNAGGAGTVTATGGVGGIGMRVSGAVVTNASDGFIAGNGGPGAASIASDYGYTATSGHGGQITKSYLDLTGISTVNVTIGAGGAGGTTAVVGGDGGDGVVIFEYVAG